MRRGMRRRDEERDEERDGGEEMRRGMEVKR